MDKNKCLDCTKCTISDERCLRTRNNKIRNYARLVSEDLQQPLHTLTDKELIETVFHAQKMLGNILQQCSPKVISEHPKLDLEMRSNLQMMTDYVAQFDYLGNAAEKEKWAAVKRGIKEDLAKKKELDNKFDVAVNRVKNLQKILINATPEDIGEKPTVSSMEKELARSAKIAWLIKRLKVQSIMLKGVDLEIVYSVLESCVNILDSVIRSKELGATSLDNK